ncbi:unnamed protein product [Triticum turgidum subsp. durum]|uniref:Uncharacterized protein n=1 Tax=Triticum turgidum subsp. durum TaxID=4567 RepID=A0A9R1B1S6_TRITD|nr:unnamed protein product [Triticum turgidum subsp. durum]
MRTSTYITSHGPKVQDDDSLQLQVPLLKHKKRGGSKAPAVILLFECLESTAFNGISTNLVVYLETVLHGTNLASASNVATWFGTSYLTPVFGAIIADSFWGNYNTILVSLAVYLLGMMLVTFSAFVPTTTAALCAAGASCATAGACWGLGFGIATTCIALAFAAFVLATPMYKRRMPAGTPLKSLCQVVAAACKKISIKVPAEAGHLYEVSDKIDSPQPRIAHTSDFKFLDKAAIVTESDMEERPEAATSWKLCTVTQVEELKILLRLLPVWITSVIVSSAYSQMNTTFVQQGSAMEMTILSVPVPAASLVSFEVICVLTWVLLYNKVIVPALRSFSSSGDGEPSQLQRMGAGRLLMALTMAVAALVEMKRLDSAARGEEISIAWQLPQYFFLAGGEVFCYIAQLEFFFGEAPDTMKSMCTSLALLTIALGSYMSSFIYAIVEAFTATGDSPGWISDDLNKGHLDYFFWAMAAMCTLNFVVYSGIVKNYRLKTVIS